MQDLDNSCKTWNILVDNSFLEHLDMIFTRSCQDMSRNFLRELDGILTIFDTWKIVFVGNPAWGGGTGNLDKSWPWPDNPDKKNSYDAN